MADGTDTCNGLVRLAVTRLRNGFVQEPEKYYQYCSYPYDSPFPRRAWKLNRETMTTLRKKYVYVIGEDKTAEEVIRLLGKILG